MSKLVKQLALVSESKSVLLPEAMSVAAALDKQATRDFGPIWGVSSSIHAFARLEDVPLGYWVLLVQDDIHVSGAAGVHLDKEGQPFSLITAGEHWSLTASHEMCEMLADPYGNRTIAGPSVKRGQGRVNYLVEVCDPSEDARYAYTVNDILVSDFYTPHYFDPVPSSSVRYSYTGAIKKPRQILRGGYLSWHEPVSDHWWQASWFSGSSVKCRDLGRITAANGSIRSQIDALSSRESMKSMIPSALLSGGSANKRGLGQTASSAKAKSIREQIDSLVSSRA